MATEMGGSQISALLESVPGIANVLRSPVADAIVNMIRAGAGVRPFAYADATELVQYAVRRGLISSAEGDAVLADVRGRGKKGRTKPAKRAAKKPVRKAAKKVAKKAVKQPASKKAAKKPAKRKPATKTAKAKKGRPAKRR